jgi:hypothetical protein
MALLDDLCKEINLHVRHVAHLLVQWYVFFVTANLIALGWIITADRTKVLITTAVLWAVVTLFVVVDVLGVCALYSVRRYFSAEDRRLCEILSTIPLDAGVPELLRSSPIPLLLYGRAIFLMASSLVALFTTWLALGLLRH